MTEAPTHRIISEPGLRERLLAVRMLLRPVIDSRLPQADAAQAAVWSG